MILLAVKTLSADDDSLAIETAEVMVLSWSAF